MLNLYGGIATIITLHRVYDPEDNKLSPNECLKVSPEFLELFIRNALRKGYAFISIDELYEVLAKRKKASKVIVMTFDDGYVDNYTYAYPILKNYNIPFTIYVTTSFPNRTAVLWWYLLEDMLIQKKKITLINGEEVLCETLRQKEQVFMMFRERILALSDHSFFESLETILEPEFFDWQQKVRDLAISWDQLKRLTKDPLITIGAHSVNHFALAKLSPAKLVDEIVKSKMIIESQLGITVEHFCYPFGGRKEASEREFQVVKNNGFKTAVTTQFGTVFGDCSNHLFSLPRVMLTNRFSWHTFNLRLMKKFLARS